MSDQLDLEAAVAETIADGVTGDVSSEPDITPSQEPDATPDQGTPDADAKEGLQVQDPESREANDASAEDRSGEGATPAEDPDDAGDDGGSAKVEEPAGAAPEDADLFPDISDTAITAAVRAGISIEDARAFASEDSLMNVVELMKIQKSAAGDKQEEKDLLDSIPDLDPEAVDPEVVKAFNEVKNVIKSQREQIDALNAQSESAQQMHASAAEREVTSWFEAKVAGLDMNDLLGDGATGTTPGTPQYAMRDKLATKVAVIHAGNEHQGVKASRDELFAEAAKLVLGDEMAKRDEEKVAHDLKKRSGQHIQRAKVTKSKPTVSVEDEIAAALDEKYGVGL